MKKSIVMALAIVAFGVPGLGQSGWGTPVNEPVLNSTAADSGPHLSADGLTLHFASFRSSNWEIYSSTRPTRTAPWGAPVVEPALGGSAVEDQPALDASGLEIYFSSTRAGGTGSSDLMRATRPTPASPWGAPTFVTELNSTLAESAPSLTADGLEIVYLTQGFGATTTNNIIVTATRPTTSSLFGTPVQIPSTANPNTHRDVEIAADGLTLTYTEFLPAPVNHLRIFRATRLTRTQPWGTPANVTEFDTTGPGLGVYGATLSTDGLEMIISAGNQELMTVRFNGLAKNGHAGVTTSMSLNFRDGARPGATYAMAAALGNTGFTLGAVTVPIDADPLFFLTLATNIPPFTSGFVGVLDAQGVGVATIGDPPAALTGARIWIAAASVDPLSPTGLGIMSNAVQIEFELL